MDLMDTGTCSFLLKEKNCWPANSLPPLRSKPLPALQLAVPSAGGPVCQMQLAGGYKLEKICIESPKRCCGQKRRDGKNWLAQLAEVRFQSSRPKQRFAIGGRRTARAGSFGRSRTGADQRHRSMGGRESLEVRCRAVLARGGREL